jgi:anthranilate/para-aminobenzoate synthase component I
MSLHAVVVDTNADALGIARQLAPWGGLSLLHRAPGSSGRLGWRASYVAVEPVESVTQLLPADGPGPEGEVGVTGARPDTRSAAPRWFGVLPYECARSLERAAWSDVDARPLPHLIAPLWRRYGAVVEVDAQRGLVRVIGDQPAQVARLARALRQTAVRAPGTRGRAQPARIAQMPSDDPPEAHLARVRRAKALIESGDLYQVNLARRLRFAVEGDALSVYAAMADKSAPPFGAYFDLGDLQLAACSPELFLSLDPERRILTAPIKGTRPRGRHAAEDRARVAELHENPKEIAELTMILDVERNDLGKVSETGSVSLLGPPSVHTHPTLHHRGGLVRARLARDASALELLRAAFPSGSVTGAPKVRAMEVIAALEPARRGVYTGALGALAHDGTLELAMAIRVLSVRDGEGHYHTGGGIVADSDAHAELEETRWKALQIADLLQGSAR